MNAAQAIVDHLDGVLVPERFDDYGPNGLQVPGRDEVEVVVTGVSAHRELLERAAQAGAGMVIVHHGLLWDGAPRRLSRTMAGRLRLLLAHDINLVASHLPLDAHPEVGNNALLARALGAGDGQPAFAHRGTPIGVRAGFAGDGLRSQELFERVADVTGRRPLVFARGPARVRSLGIVSGGGARSLAEAVEAGLDAFVTGEPAEQSMAEAAEAGIHFIAAGHHATETFGVRRLGELVAARFDVEHHFIDVPNPV